MPVYVFPSKVSWIMLLVFRRRRPGEIDSPGRRQPIAQVHIDQTAATSITKVHKYLPASDVPKLLEHRFQIINLWRPVAAPVVDWPLALCDFRSFDLEKDTFPVALIFPDRKGETVGLKYDENHKWKYLHAMTPEEIVLIKWQVYSLFNLLVFGFESDLFMTLALIVLEMRVLPLPPRTLLSGTQTPPMEHPFANQLKSGLLCFMTEYLVRR